MKIIEKEVMTKDLLTKSNLPASDYVINPYIGCPHACKYCYARFMKRFTGHTEAWGSFIDIKCCDKPINIKKLCHKSVFISSVTDCFVTISTKSNLILRDIDLLKQFQNLTAAISINTLDENFQKDMDCASSIRERIETLKTLHSQGIHTVLFMSPIFPFITDFKKMIEATKAYVCEYFFNKGCFRYEGIMLIGTMEVLQDEAIKREIWRPGDTMFYKQGVTDPDYCVLKFTAVKGRHYCDLKTESFEICDLK